MTGHLFDNDDEVDTTGLIVTVPRGGVWRELDITALTDMELEVLFERMSEEDSKQWNFILVTWIRDNVIPEHASVTRQ